MPNVQRLLALAALLLVSVLSPFATLAASDVSQPAVSVMVPPSVGDGTAFVCTVSAPNLQAATVTFLNRSMTVRPPAAEPGVTRMAVLLLPVPLDHASATVQMSWSAAFKDGSTLKGTTPITIIKKVYPVQRLTLEQKYVTPDPELKDRITRERNLLNAALTTRSGERHWSVPMVRPVPGKITSWYGLRRVLNGQSRSPHKGLDFRAAAADPIVSIADGKVVLTGDFYYPGKFAVIDHGLGVTSIYMHMSEILVEDGHKIQAGEKVGLVGSTGRSTGPHLHLGLNVLGQSIDALPLLAMTPEDEAAYKKAFSDAAREEKNVTKAGKKSSSAKVKSGRVPSRKKQ